MIETTLASGNSVAGAAYTARSGFGLRLRLRRNEPCQTFFRQVYKHGGQLAIEPLVGITDKVCAYVPKRAPGPVRHPSDQRFFAGTGMRLVLEHATLLVTFGLRLIFTTPAGHVTIPTIVGIRDANHDIANTDKHDLGRVLVDVHEGVEITGERYCHTSENHQHKSPKWLFVLNQHHRAGEPNGKDKHRPKGDASE